MFNLVCIKMISTYISAVIMSVGRFLPIWEGGPAGQSQEDQTTKQSTQKHVGTGDSIHPSNVLWDVLGIEILVLKPCKNWQSVSICKALLYVYAIRQIDASFRILPERFSSPPTDLTARKPWTWMNRLTDKPPGKSWENHPIINECQWIMKHIAQVIETLETMPER